MGKTYKAIEFAHANDAYIVVMSKQEADRVFNMAQRMNKPIRFPIVFGEHRCDGIKNPIVIDNADWILQRLLAAAEGIHNIAMMTFTDRTIQKIKNPHINIDYELSEQYLNGEWPTKEKGKK